MKPFDFSKFRKNVNKATGLVSGFHDPKTWIDTGNYALNFIISGDFFKGIPLSRVSVFAGESGCTPESAEVTIRYSGKDTTDWITIETTVGEFKKIWDADQYDIEIDTPDGWQPIVYWFNKGILDIVEVTTIRGLKTKCAVNHLLEINRDGTHEWIWAQDLEEGDKVITKTGLQTVKSIKEMPAEECYDFEVDHPNHRYWCDGFSSHNSGKSYIASGNLIRNAQKMGIHTILFDSEYALDKSWLYNLGVDPDKLIRFPAGQIDELAKTISEFMKQYEEDHGKDSPEDRPKFLIVADSLGMLDTPTAVEQFEKGDMKGDMGRKPKQLKALVTQCLKLFGPYDIGLVATNHTYKSQDMWNPDDVIAGGSGFVFASSIIVTLQKFKLKENEDGEKTKEVHGIRAKIKCIKSRYAKPFEEVEINIPYSTGMDPYSGLIELFEKSGNLIKDGNKLKYIDKNGIEHKHFRKQITDDLLMQIMKEYDPSKQEIVGVDETPIEYTE